MIQKLDISGVHMDVDDNLRKYVAKKIGRLDRFVPRSSRISMHAAVKLKESRARDKKECTSEIILHLPQGELTVQESTINMYAALDIAEEKLKTQLKKYKETHFRPRFHQ